MLLLLRAATPVDLGAIPLCSVFSWMFSFPLSLRLSEVFILTYTISNETHELITRHLGPHRCKQANPPRSQSTSWSYRISQECATSVYGIDLLKDTDSKRIYTSTISTFLPAPPHITQRPSVSMASRNDTT
jgi:hypothetical protein